MNKIMSAAPAAAGAYAPTPLEIELAIDEALEERWGADRRRPEISDMKFEGDDQDWLELKFTVELDGDLELPFEMPDAEILHILHGDLNRYAADVAAVCAEVLSHAEELRAAQSEMRRRLEGFSRELAAGGLELPLFWLSLAPYDHWSTPADVRFDIALAGLGDHLRAADILGEAGLHDDLAVAFAHALDTQRDRSRQVAENRAAGAHGRADALALALIGADPYPLDALRDERTRDDVVLADGISLHWSHGVLRSSGTLPGGVGWFHDRIELPGRWFSAPAAAAMIGRSAGEVVDHPAFANITIREVASEIVSGKPMTIVDLRTPVSFFDAPSGRSWPVGDANGR